MRFYRIWSPVVGALLVCPVAAVVVDSYNAGDDYFVSPNQSGAWKECGRLVIESDKHSDLRPESIAWFSPPGFDIHFLLLSMFFCVWIAFSVGLIWWLPRGWSVNNVALPGGELPINRKSGPFFPPRLFVWALSTAANKLVISFGSGIGSDIREGIQTYSHIFQGMIAGFDGSLKQKKTSLV